MTKPDTEKQVAVEQPQPTAWHYRIAAAAAMICDQHDTPADRRYAIAHWLARTEPQAPPLAEPADDTRKLADREWVNNWLWKSSDELDWTQERFKVLVDMIQQRDAERDAEIKARIKRERQDLVQQVKDVIESGSKVTLANETSQWIVDTVEALRKEVERLKEVWEVMDQTIACTHCGWIDWTFDGKYTEHWEYNTDCPIGHMQIYTKELQSTLAERDKQIAELQAENKRLRELFTKPMGQFLSVIKGMEKAIADHAKCDQWAESHLARIREALETKPAEPARGTDFVNRGIE